MTRVRVTFETDKDSLYVRVPDEHEAAAYYVPASSSVVPSDAVVKALPDPVENGLYLATTAAAAATVVYRREDKGWSVLNQSPVHALQWRSSPSTAESLDRYARDGYFRRIPD